MSISKREHGDSKMYSNSISKAPEALLEVAEAITSTLDLEDVLKLILDKAIELVGPADGRIRLLDKEGKKLVPVVAIGYKDLTPATWDVGDCIAGYVAMTGKPDKVSNVPKDERFKKALEKIKDPEYKEYLKTVRSEVAVPLQIKDRVIGVLNVHSTKENAFTDEDMTLLYTLGKQIAIVIQNARLFNALQEIGLSITGDRDEVLGLILERGMELVGAHNGRIRLIDEKKEELESGIARGFRNEKKPRRKIGEGIAGEVARTGSPLNVPNVRKNKKFKQVIESTKDKEYKKYLESVRSEVAVPFKIKDRITGVLSVHSPKENAFTDDDMKLLTALAGQVSIVIQNAQLFNALKDVGSKLILSTDEQSITNAIARMVCDLMNFPACSIWIPVRVPGKDEQELRIKASAGLREDYVKKARISLSDEITGLAMKEKRPIAVLNTAEDPRMVYLDVKEMGYMSLLSVPMIVGGDAIGTINVYTRVQHEFTDYEKGLLGIFGNQAGMVIKSAKLSSTRKDIIKSILQLSLKGNELDELLNEVVKIGKEYLDSKSCTIFLLDDDKETLRIRAGAGEIGKNLMKLNARYYVPKRGPFESLKERRSNVDEECIKNIEKYDWETRKNLVEERKLPMGITAYVVRADDHRGEEILLPYDGKEVRNHLEWLGRYEPAQGEICTSIVEIPLIFRGNAEGVIKIENHLQNKLFTEEHREITSILADYVVLAIERVRYQLPSYKVIFGTKLLDELESL